MNDSNNSSQDKQPKHKKMFDMSPDRKEKLIKVLGNRYIKDDSQSPKKKRKVNLDYLENLAKNSSTVAMSARVMENAKTIHKVETRFDKDIKFIESKNANATNKSQLNNSTLSNGNKYLRSSPSKNLLNENN